MVRMMQCEVRIHAEDFDCDGPYPDSDVQVWVGEGYSGVRLAFGYRFGEGEFIVRQRIDLDGRLGAVAALLNRLAQMLQTKETAAQAPARP